MYSDFKEEEKGNLVYQEGKTLNDTFFVFSVYQNGEKGVYTFRAYDLDNNETLHIIYAYHDFESLFRDHAELTNQKSKDGRYRWLIERLDVAGEPGVGRRLVLAPEPTTETQETTQTTSYTGGGAANQGWSFAERQRKTQDQEKLEEKRNQNIVAKKERARKQFITELEDKRRLENLKATARKERINEERAERLNRLERAKQTTEEKEQRYRELAEVRAAKITTIEGARAEREKEMIVTIRAHRETGHLQSAKTTTRIWSDESAALREKRAKREEEARMENLRERERQKRIQAYHAKEQAYLEARATRKEALEHEAAAKPARKAAFVQRRSDSRAQKLREKYEKEQEWEDLEMKRHQMESDRESKRNEELFLRIDQARAQEEREALQARKQREAQLAERKQRETTMLDEARKEAAEQARLEAKRQRAYGDYYSRVDSKGDYYVARIGNESKRARAQAAEKETRLEEARASIHHASSETWSNKAKERERITLLQQKRKAKEAARDAELSRQEGARAKRANLILKQKEELIQAAKEAKVLQQRGEARSKQEIATLQKKTRADCEARREANIKAREEARERREMERIAAEKAGLQIEA